MSHAAFDRLVAEQHYFSAIVGNPPYQKSAAQKDGLSLRNVSKAVPIYQEFVERAKTLQPAVMSVIMPARWYTGGWGLDVFRTAMLTDPTLSHLIDFRRSSQIFPATDVNGGVSVCLWTNNPPLLPRVQRYDLAQQCVEDSSRRLSLPAAEFLVRDHRSLTIIEKAVALQKTNGAFTDHFVGGYGLSTNFTAHQPKPDNLTEPVSLFFIGERVLWMDRSLIPSKQDSLDQWKLFIPLSHNERSNVYVGRVHMLTPPSACTHSYIAVQFDSREQAESALAYVRTKTFRFLVGQLKISPIGTKRVYRLVPALPWDQTWTEQNVSEALGLTPQEIAYIEASVAPAR